MPWYAEEVVRESGDATHRCPRVEVPQLRSAGGATAYLALHHEKTDQGPPAGWTGKRLRPSRGYFGPPGTDRDASASKHARHCSTRLRAAAQRARDEPRRNDEAHDVPAVVLRRLLEREPARVISEQKQTPRTLVRVRSRIRIDRNPAK